MTADGLYSVPDVVDNVPLAAWFATMSARTDADPDFDAAAAIAQRAVSLVPGCASVAVIERRPDQRPRVVTASHPDARQLEEVQIEHGAGPSVLALDSGRAAVTRSLAGQDAWPALAAAAAELGVHAAWCAPVGGAYPVVVSGYGAQDCVPDDIESSSDFTMFRVFTAMLLSQMSARRDAVCALNALESNRRVGIAMGILMNASRITDVEAFQILREASQRLHRKVRDIADEVIYTGSAPELPRRRRSAGQSPAAQADRP